MKKKKKKNGYIFMCFYVYRLPNIWNNFSINVFFFNIVDFL